MLREESRRSPGAPAPSRDMGARCSSRVVTSQGDMERLRPFWEELNWHPNAEIDFYRLVNETLTGSPRPYIVVLESKDTPQGLVLGRLGEESLRCKVGYRTLRLGKVRQLSILHGGVLGCADPFVAEIAVTELMRVLRRGEADVVHFNHLAADSELFRLATRSPGFFSRDHLVRPQPHWAAALPATRTEFLQRLRKKHRYWVRRAEKLLDAAFPGEVSFRSFGPDWPLEQLMADVESVAAKTYQRGLGAGFHNGPVQARRLAHAAARGWLRVCVLYVANRPCAFWMGRAYKGVYYSDATGYDPAYKKFEVGTAVFLRTVEQLCAEGVRKLDFGLGDALYKERFGDESWSESQVWIYSPSLRGGMLNVARTSIEAPALCLEALLRRTKLQQRLKTLWRRRLVKAQAE